MSGFALKLVAWIVALALVALPVVGLVNGWFASGRWPFKRLEVEAEFERVNAEQLRAAVSPHLEAGFFAADLDRVRRGVESLPWVESAYVRKRWPDVLEVRVVERRAAAVWGDARLVSTAGELFAVPGDLAPQGLPRLAGPEDRALEVLEFHGAAREVFARSGLGVAGTELSGRGSWSLALENGARVVVGRESPRDRLQRFVDPLPRIASNDGAVWVRADLRYANGYALEWRVPEPEPPPQPEPVPSEPSALS
jgi:cell division protein FtsQ